MKKIEYHKLIRDRIPAIIEAKGDIPVIESLSPEDFPLMLEKKLQEEVDEYFESKAVDELADIIEVIYALAELQAVGKEELETIRQNKHDERGGFRERLLLKEVIKQGENEES